MINLQHKHTHQKNFAPGPAVVTKEPLINRPVILQHDKAKQTFSSASGINTKNE